MAFANVYNLRKVAEGSAKACDICFKQSTSVLITPDSKDFFYICPSHLTDRKFCTPIVDEAADAAKKKAREEKREKEMKEEVERVKKEYEERQRKKKEKDKDKDDKRKSDEAKTDEKKDEDEKNGDDEEEKEEPRVFALGRLWFQARLSKRRQVEEQKRRAEQSKLNQQRLQNPDFFPSVPSAAPGKAAGSTGAGSGPADGSKPA